MTGGLFGYHLGDKTVTALRNRHDVLLMVRVVSEHLPERGNVPRKAALFDEGVGPHRFEQMLLFKEPPIAFNQRNKSVKDFRREWNDFVSPCQQALVTIDPVGAELQNVT